MILCVHHHSLCVVATVHSPPEESSAQPAPVSLNFINKQTTTQLPSLREVFYIFLHKIEISEAEGKAERRVLRECKQLLLRNVTATVHHCPSVLNFLSFCEKLWRNCQSSRRRWINGTQRANMYEVARTTPPGLFCSRGNLAPSVYTTANERGRRLAWKRHKFLINSACDNIKSINGRK